MCIKTRAGGVRGATVPRDLRLCSFLLLAGSEPASDFPFLAWLSHPSRTFQLLITFRFASAQLHRCSQPRHHCTIWAPCQSIQWLPLHVGTNSPRGGWRLGQVPSATSLPPTICGLCLSATNQKIIPLCQAPRTWSWTPHLEGIKRLPGTCPRMFRAGQMGGGEGARSGHVRRGWRNRAA